MKSVAILGGGESGIGAALLAKQNKIEVFVSDYGSISEKYKAELKENNIPFEEKGHSIERLENADLIVKSPGIPDTSEIVTKLRLRHKEIVSEIEFAYGFFQGKIIAVTGSNGKTTTASLVYHIMKNSEWRVGLGGNIGHSFARLLSTNENYDWVVLELSSFQLDNILTFSAEIAIVLNITPDHLDRYDHCMYRYALAKWQLARSVKQEDHLIINEDDEWLELMNVAFPSHAHMHGIGYNKIRTSGLKYPDVSLENLKLRGAHNLFNTAVAIKTCKLAGMSSEKIEGALSSFSAIEHRLESFAMINGVEFINDSKATNVDSVLVALESMRKPVIWVAGGIDKGNDYTQLAGVVNEKVKELICLTKDDSKLKAAFGSMIEKISSAEDVDGCVRLAMDAAEEGDVVLLSPACSSFDLFDN